MVAQVRSTKKRPTAYDLRIRRSTAYGVAPNECILFFRPGVHIGNLDARHTGMFVGDVEGAGSRRRLAVVHSGHVSELAAKRVASGRRAVDALFGDALYTRDAVVPRAEWQRRGSRQQFAVATRRARRHPPRVAGDCFFFKVREEKKREHADFFRARGRSAIVPSKLANNSADTFPR